MTPSAHAPAEERLPSSAPQPFDVARTFLHKDVAELAIPLVALWVLAVAQLTTRIQLAFLADLFVALLTARWVLTDPPANPHAFWHTLPVRSGTLLAAKWAALCVLVILPLLVFEAVLAARVGLAGGEIATVLVAATIYLAVLVFAASAIAVGSRDVPNFVMRSAAIFIIVLVAFMAATWLGTKVPAAFRAGKPRFFETGMIGLSLPFFVASAWWGARRPERLALRVILSLGLGLGTLFVVRPFAWSMTSFGDVHLAPGVSIHVQLVNVSTMDGIDWPDGVPVAIDKGPTPDDQTVWLRGLAGSLRLATGRTIPVFRERSEKTTFSTINNERTLQIVTMLDLDREEIARVSDVPGRLELDVRLQRSVDFVQQPSRTFRILRTERRHNTLVVRIEYLTVPGLGLDDGERPHGLEIWDSSRTQGFRINANGVTERRRVGIVTHPELQMVTSELTFNLENAQQLRSGEQTRDASSVITDRWLAAAQIELKSRRWGPVETRKIVIPDFRIGDWMPNER